MLAIAPTFRLALAFGLALASLSGHSTEGAIAEHRRAQDEIVPSAPPIHFTIRGRWPRPNKLTVHIDTSSCPVDSDAFVRAVERALDAWRQTKVVDFKVVDAAATPDFTVGWRTPESTRGRPFRHGRIAQTGPIEPGTFVYFNSKLRWSFDGARAPGMVQTAIHEIGHILGLDHSSNPDSALFSRYDKSNSTLSESDRAAIHTLYGGGEDGPGDLRLVRFNPDGVIEPLGHPLRRVAPDAARDFAVLDLDGDGHDELLTWPRTRDYERGFLIFRFNLRHQVEQTLGPFPLLVESGLAVHFSTSSTGKPLVVHHDKSGKYTASAFGSPKILPLTPWPARTPLHLANGLRDSDGDGVLDTIVLERPESPIASWRYEDRCDLDLDGELETLVSQPRDGEREYAWIRDGKRLPPFRAKRVLRSDVNGDGKAEWIVLR